MTENLTSRSDGEGGGAMGGREGSRSGTPDSPAPPPLSVTMYGWLGPRGWIHCHPCCPDVELFGLASTPVVEVLFDEHEKRCGFCFPGEGSVLSRAGSRAVHVQKFYRTGAGANFDPRTS